MGLALAKLEGTMIDKTFERWLVGFFEGDGYLRYGSHGKDYSVVNAVLAQKDVSVLEYVKDVLGYGNMNRRKDGVTNLQFWGKQRCLPILEGLVKYCVTKHKLAQLSDTLTKMGITAKPTLHAPTLDWIVGFWDAEGSSSLTGPAHVVLNINIVQADIEVLTSVRNFLGYGSIYTTKNNPPSGNAIHRLSFHNEHAYELAGVLLEKSKCLGKRTRLSDNLAIRALCLKR